MLDWTFSFLFLDCHRNDDGSSPDSWHRIFVKEKKSLYEFIALSSRFYSPQSQTEERKQKNGLLRCRITFFGSSERLRFIYFFFHSGQWKTTIGLFVQRVCRLLSWNRMANIFFSLLPFRPKVCMIKWLCRYS